MKRKSLHRRVFVVAALYNFAWALFSAVYPQWLFDFAGMERLNRPEIFACLAMVVGTYGIVYAEVARRPEHGFLLAAVGLLGKVLGPVGWLNLYLTGEWPLETIILIVTNDLIWWIPFILYLRDSWPYYRKSLKRA